MAKETNAYLSKGEAYDPHAIHSGIFRQFGISLKRVQQTLSFICQTQTEDSQQQRNSRLTDLAFLNQHFDFYSWRPDLDQVAQYANKKPLLQNLPGEKILLTKYYVKKASAGRSANPARPHAMYAIPFDEAPLNLEQADAKRDQITRYRYTKAQVLEGVLERNNLAEPLIYLSRSNLEDSLMQGTLKAELDDGESLFFNVHRNNGYAYDRNISKELQKRYWYFKQVPGVMGYGKDAEYKIKIQPLVTLAGDLKLLGLGKLILLSSNNTHRMAILADTGGAFENNAYQLDYLAGYYFGWRDYHAQWRSQPDYYQANIMLLKPSPRGETHE